MRSRSLLVLLALVLGLGAFIWFYERQLPGSEEREAQARRLVPGLDPGTVTAIDLERGEEKVRLERSPAAGDGVDADADEGTDEPMEEAVEGPASAEWRLAAPERLAGAPADRVAVEGLLSALAAVEKSRSLASIDRRALGLEPPRVRVRLELADGEPIVLAVGEDLPASSDMVVLVEATGEAHVVDRTILQDLTRAAGDWRSRQIFTVGRDQVTRITLAGGDDDEVALERAAGGFRMVRPIADLADPTAVEQLLGSLTGLTAERFVDDPDALPAELGLEPPRGRATVELAGGRPPLVVEIGAPRAEGAGHTFRVGGQLFVAENALPEAVEREAGAWQSPALTSLELYRIDEVGVEGEAPLHLARSGTDWRRDGEAISYTPVSDFLFSLVEARAEEVVPLAAGSRETPRLTVELVAAARGEGGEPERQAITFHAERDGLVPVVVSGRSFELRLPPADFETILANLERVRSAPPVGGSAAEETIPDGVEIEREEGS
ncbi:MAG TPA: DUF4340 domain-containing protein [Thermoanaerobaculia bacterium]|nr:DUF4340 domain-containing protein [Thermoanaerobaculia bacterium]